MRFDSSSESEAAAGRRRMVVLPLHWILRPLGYLECTDVYRIELDGLPPIKQVGGYDFVEATPAEVDTIARELKWDQPAGVLKMLRDQGHHCFVAKFEGSIVAYDWIAFSSVQEQEYACQPASDDCICLNAYTEPKHRGKGLHPALLLGMLHFAAAKRKRHAYTMVSLLNIASWKTHVRMGWRREFTTCYFRPNFVPGRWPWVIMPGEYPVKLDWSRHSWIAAKRAAAQ